MKSNYRAAKDRAIEYLSQRSALLRFDDDVELLTILAPSDSQAPLEIYLAGGLFEVAMCEAIHFDEIPNAPDEVAAEVTFLIETVLLGLREITWSRKGEIVVAKAVSTLTGFRATTSSTFLPRFLLERTVKEFQPYP